MRATLANIALGSASSVAAVAASQIQFNDAPRNLCVQANLTAPQGGTTADAYLQTSLDGGLTWIDIAQFHFTTSAARFAYNLSSLTPVTTEYTPTDGTLAANTAKDGILGPLFQVKFASTGTYTGGTLRIDIATNDR